MKSVAVETQTSAMEATTCLFCGVNDERPLLRREEPRHVICRRCGFVYQNPRPTIAEMSRHYQEEYWESRGLNSARVDPVDLNSNPRPVGMANMLRGRITANDLVLEVGCGHAEILAHVRDQLSCQVLGIEPSSAQAAAARERFGIEILCSDLESMDLGGRSPKAIILSHVLEHIYEPLWALKRLNDVLADGGLLLIEVPNMLKPHHTKRLSNWLAREHVYYFSRASLTRLLEMSGFQTVQAQERDYLRLLAQKSTMAAKVSSVAALPSEYWRVRRALVVHEMLYWPWYSLKRLGLISRDCGKTSRVSPNEHCAREL